MKLSVSSGWSGNGTGNSGVTYNSDGVSFNASRDGLGVAIDLAAPIQLEDAIITMVINVSSEFKASGGKLQPFAQIKGGSWGGEWDCTIGNDLLTAGSDVAITCTIAEADKKFNQTTYDVQIGIQGIGTPTGVVTIKSASITLKPQASSSNLVAANAAFYIKSGTSAIHIKKAFHATRAAKPTQTPG